MSLKAKKIAIFSLICGLSFAVIDLELERYSDRDLYLVGALVLHGDKAVKDCAIVKNGIKYSLDRRQIEAAFNFGHSTFQPLDLGPNGFGDDCPVEFHLADGSQIDTLISYDSTRHMIKLDVYGGYIKDADFLCTKLTDPAQIELVGSLFSSPPRK